MALESSWSSIFIHEPPARDSPTRYSAARANPSDYRGQYQGTDEFRDLPRSTLGGHQRGGETVRITFPGESAEYRAARDGLLNQEIELRRVMEAVAVARRRLPPGGVVPQDYVFQ